MKIFIGPSWRKNYKSQCYGISAVGNKGHGLLQSRSNYGSSDGDDMNALPMTQRENIVSRIIKCHRQILGYIIFSKAKSILWNYQNFKLNKCNTSQSYELRKHVSYFRVGSQGATRVVAACMKKKSRHDFTNIVLYFGVYYNCNWMKNVKTPCKQSNT